MVGAFGCTAPLPIPHLRGQGEWKMKRSLRHNLLITRAKNALLIKKKSCYGTSIAKANKWRQR